MKYNKSSVKSCQTVHQFKIRIEPVKGRLYDMKAWLRPDVLTTWLQTNLYLRSDFILRCFVNTVKTKEIQSLPFSRKIRLFWKKFLYHQLPNMMIHTHAKLAPLGLIYKKKMIGKSRSFDPNRTSPLVA